MRERRGVGELRHPRSRSLDERNRSTGLADSPRSERQIDHSGGARVGREPNRQLVVATGLKQGERTFQLAHGFDEFAGEIVGHPLDPMGDASL